MALLGPRIDLRPGALRVRGVAAILAIALAGAPVLLTPACSSTTERSFDRERDETTPEQTESGANPAPPGSAEPTPTDDASPPPEDTCRRTGPNKKCGTSPQCGCAKNETCDVRDDDGNTACVPAGKAPMGHACTATVGCQVGLTCVFGTCHAFCETPGSACTLPGTGQCTQLTTFEGDPLANLTVCTVKCAPHDANACGGITNAGVGACVVDEVGATDCQAGGKVAENQTCADASECGPGLVCITPNGSPTSVCKRWCRVGQNADCGGQMCRGFATEIKVGDVVYGACP